MQITLTNHLINKHMPFFIQGIQGFIDGLTLITFVTLIHHIITHK